MRALVQRVLSAEVVAPRRLVGEISRGLVVYLGVAASDSTADAGPLAEKIANLRIFEDADGKLNLSVRDIGGAILAVSNFTMLGDTRKGRRPSFTAAAPSDAARPLYEAFAGALEQQGLRVARGSFGEHMEIRSLADGPVNLVVEFPMVGSPGKLQPEPGSKG